MTNIAKKKNKRIIILMSVILVLLIILGIFIGVKKLGPEGVSHTKKVEFDLGNDLVVTEIGSYTGNYMEDASDEEVSEVLEIMVTNNGEYPLQYAEITLESEEDSTLFKLSTLNPGETVMVLEAERKSYNRKIDYTKASAQNVVFFSEALDTKEDELEIQPLDGGFNIRNISGKDIAGEIVIYFKDYKDNLYYGGITYRGRIQDGLKADEVRQIMTENFTESETKVMFITVEEE